MQHCLTTRWRFVVACAALGSALVLGTRPASAETDADVVAVELLTDRSEYAPGDTAQIALRLTIEPGWHINNDLPPIPDLIPTTVQFDLPAGWPAPILRFPAPAPLRLPSVSKPLLVYEERALIIARIAIPPDAAPGARHLTGLLTYQACDAQRCVAPRDVQIETRLVVGERGATRHVDVFEAARMDGAPGSGPVVRGGANRSAVLPETNLSSLGAILALAFLGGLILNVMPCVLPVLSLKVLGVIRADVDAARGLRLGALATAAGIVLSFECLAGFDLPEILGPDFPRKPLINNS